MKINHWIFISGAITLLLITLPGCNNQLTATSLPATPTIKTGTAAPSPAPTFAPTPPLPKVAVTPIAYPNQPITPENAAQVIQLGLLPPPQQGELMGISDLALLPVSSTPEATDKLFVAYGFKEQGKSYPSVIKGIAVWDIATGKLEQIFGQILDDAVFKFALSADGQTLISSGVRQASVSLWDFPGDRLLVKDFVATMGDAYNLDISSDGQLMAATSEQYGGVGVYGIQQKFPRWPPKYGLGHDHLDGPAGLMRDCCIEMVFSTDGSKLASVGAGRDVYLWDMKTGQKIYKWLGNTSKYYRNQGLSFSPDGRLLAAPDDEAIRIWDVASGTTLRQMTHAEKYWTSVAFSPDGRLLAAGTKSYNLPQADPGQATLQLWEVETGKLLHLWSHPADVTKLAFSHDGKLLISGATDGVARLWGIPPR